MGTVRRSLRIAVSTAATSLALTAAAHAQLEIDPAHNAELEYRYIGPPGNR